PGDHAAPRQNSALEQPRGAGRIGPSVGNVGLGRNEDARLAMTEPRRVGRYEIIRPLARSMTNVYLAIDTVGNRKTALKLIKPDGERGTQLVMEAERRGAAIQQELWTLDPRMVEVYDYGDADGYFFVAM